MSHRTGGEHGAPRPEPAAAAALRAGGPGAAVLVLVAALMQAGVTPAPCAAPAPKGRGEATGDAVSVRPQAQASSNYTIDVRLRIDNRDVTFEAPPAYHDSFAFWTNRVKGSARAEMYRFLITTEAAADDGTVPFRRLLPRFSLEMEHDGQIRVPYGTLEKQMTSQVWSGVMDRYGNVREISRLQGSDSPDQEQLALPHVEKVFPDIDGPRELRPGQAFSNVASLPLPSKLTISGLESVRMLVARDYILKEKRGRLAVFEVKTSFASDPAAPPTAPETTCVIGGGGDGEATFDLEGGYFLSTRIKAVLQITVEAPLRPLPDHPETAAGSGSASTHLEIGYDLTATQTVARWAGAPEE